MAGKVLVLVERSGKEMVKKEWKMGMRRIIERRERLETEGSDDKEEFNRKSHPWELRSESHSHLL